MKDEDIARAAHAAHPVFVANDWTYTLTDRIEVPTEANLALTIASIARTAREAYEESDEGIGQCRSGRFTVTVERDDEMGEIDTTISLDLVSVSELSAP